MLTIKINDKNTHREKDDNGFLIVRNNPVAKAGVFDYLLGEINPNCKESDSQKIVKVYRDWDMLKSVKDSLANKPIKDEHYWVGDESNTADGAIGSEVTTDEENLYLIADLFIYNPLLIQKIESGEAVELSPAYTSEIIAEKGEFNGVAYEYKQNIQSFNHLAVVENGRSGKDLKIQDKGVKMNFKEKMLSAISKIFDELPDESEESNSKCTEDNEAGAQDEDKREIIREIMAIASKPESEFNGGENEKVETIAKLAEKLAYNPSEAQANDEDTEGEANNLDSENESGNTQAETTINVGELKTEILNEVAEAVNEAIVKAQDSMFKLQKQKEKAYQKVQDSIKAPFDYSKMSVSEIYNVGYEALSGKKVSSGLDSETAFTILSNQIQSNVRALDSKPSSESLNLSKFK